MSPRFAEGDEGSSCFLGKREQRANPDFISKEAQLFANSISKKVNKKAFKRGWISKFPKPIIRRRTGAIFRWPVPAWRDFSHYPLNCGLNLWLSLSEPVSPKLGRLYTRCEILHISWTRKKGRVKLFQLCVKLSTHQICTPAAQNKVDAFDMAGGEKFTPRK